MRKSSKKASKKTPASAEGITDLKVGDFVWVWSEENTPEALPEKYQVLFVMVNGSGNTVIWFAPDEDLANGGAEGYKTTLYGLEQHSCDEWSESVFFSEESANERVAGHLDDRINDLDGRLYEVRAAKKRLAELKAKLKQ